MNEKIYIIGSGAIGKVLAVALKQNNKNVTILRGSVNDTSSSMEKIQVVSPDQSITEAVVEVSTINNFEELDGIIVLTNKSFGNAQLASALKNKVKNSPVVLLQNGLGVEQVFIDNNFPEVYRCVLFVTSQFSTDNKINFKPVATSPIGLIKGDMANLNSIVEALSGLFFPFKAEPNIQPIIWKKAIANSVFNSVCPLLEIDNGIFQKDANALNIAKRIITECVAIANANGVALHIDDVVENLLLISKLSDGMLISTLQDINNKRQTEIETLNFEIVRIAEKLGLGHRVTETKLLGELTKLKSDLNR